MSNFRIKKLDLDQEIKIQDTHLIQIINRLARIDLCQEITDQNLI
jgi:hypothetical protein